MSQEWIPKYIQKTIAFRERDVVSAAEYNAILNLLVAQGDYNSQWLDWLTKDGLQEYFNNMDGEDITAKIVEVAQGQLDTLAAASVNKTCAHLNYPVFTFLDTSYTKSANEFLEVMDECGVHGTVSCYTNYASDETHMTFAELRSAQDKGHGVVNHGTVAEDITVDNVEEVLVSSTDAMVRNGLKGYDVFAYSNSEKPDDAVTGVIDTKCTHAIGNETGLNDTDDYDTAWVRVVPLSSDDDTIAALVDGTVRNNWWCVFVCDSSVEDFDFTRLNALVAKVTEAGGTVVPAPAAAALASNTINNSIKSLQERVTALEQTVKGLVALLVDYRRITHGHTSEGLPKDANEGDIHIMYT